MRLLIPRALNENAWEMDVVDGVYGVRRRAMVSRQTWSLWRNAHRDPMEWDIRVTTWNATDLALVKILFLF